MENLKDYETNEIIESKNNNKSANNIYKYIFVLIYYFIIVDVILGALILPMARKNLIIDDLNSATTIVDAVLYDKDGLALIKYLEYEELKDSFYMTVDNKNEETEETLELIVTIGFLDLDIDTLELTLFDEVGDNSYVLIANYTNQNISSFYIDDDLDLEYVSDILTGKIKTFEKGSKIHFYYSPTYFENESFSENNTFIPQNSFTSNFSIIHNLIYYLMLFLPLLIIFIKPLVKAFKELFTSKERTTKILPATGIALAVGIGSGLLSNLLKIAVGLPMGTPLNQKSIETMMTSSLAIVLVLTVVILGPFVEEVVFRKSLFGLIKNDKIALVVSSLLFALIHISNEPSIVYALVNSISYLGGGLAFGLLYMKNEKNVALTIMAHSIYNLISVLPMLF